ncbi:hypothetical protein [Streptomyces sp. NPDC001401]|uniref:hypothetical protein n=1 Tax=Streptomyces sp. NPDC001401 TaxID=3364570 RepID=UPI0036B53FAE
MDFSVVAVGRQDDSPPDEPLRAALTAGPVPVSVRDPYTLARGAASVAAVTGGRSAWRWAPPADGSWRACTGARVGSAAVPEESAAAVRALLHAAPGEPVAAAQKAGRTPPALAAWLPAAVDGERTLGALSACV